MDRLTDSDSPVDACEGIGPATFSLLVPRCIAPNDHHVRYASGYTDR